MTKRNRYFTDLSRAVSAPTLGDLEEAGQIAGAAADFTWAINNGGFEDPRIEGGIADVCNVIFDLVHTVVSNYVDSQRGSVQNEA